VVAVPPVVPKAVRCLEGVREWSGRRRSEGEGMVGRLDGSSLEKTTTMTKECMPASCFTLTSTRSAQTPGMAVPRTAWRAFFSSVESAAISSPFLVFVFGHYSPCCLPHSPPSPTRPWRSKQFAAALSNCPTHLNTRPHTQTQAHSVKPPRPSRRLHQARCCVMRPPPPRLLGHLPSADPHSSTSSSAWFSPACPPPPLR